MRFHLERRIILALVIGSLFIIFTALGTIVISTQYTQTVNELLRYNRIQSTISNLTVEIVDAETGQRGYLITGNASYLSPYQSSLNSISSTNSSLGRQVSGDANLSALWTELQPLITQKLNELNETIVLRQTQGFAAAQAVVNTNLGQNYMNDIRQVLGEMSDRVLQLQTEESEAAASQSRERTAVTYLNTAVSIVAFSVAIYLSVRNLQSEQKARREAELLQDLLTHDIRNYNQVSKMGAELLYDIHKNDPETENILTSILDSIDGSTQLVEKGKKLGRVLSDEKVQLERVDLLKTIVDSASLVKNAVKLSGKQFVNSVTVKDQNQTNVFVMADKLLDDVFTNIYSNSAKYTDGDDVFVQTVVEESDEKYWKISVIDSGRGIPDELKNRIFVRYLKTAKGSGLGMSIVHALVVERYKGKIDVKNAVPDDYKKGTSIEIWLRKA